MTGYTNLKELHKTISKYGLEPSMKELISNEVTLSKLIDLDKSDDEICSALEGLIGKLRDKLKRIWEARQEAQRKEAQKREAATAKAETERLDKQEATRLRNLRYDNPSEYYWEVMMVKSGVADKITSGDLSAFRNTKVTVVNFADMKTWQREYNDIINFIKTMHPEVHQYSSEDDVDITIDKFAKSRKWKYATIKSGFGSDFSVYNLITNTTIGKWFKDLNTFKQNCQTLINMMDEGTDISTDLNNGDDIYAPSEDNEDYHERFREGIGAFMYEYMYQHGPHELTTYLYLPLMKLISPEYYEEHKEEMHWS